MTQEELEQHADNILGFYTDFIEFDVKAEDKNPRHLAYTEWDEVSTVVISPRLARFHEDKVKGVLFHELGHVLDELFVYADVQEQDPELRADAIIEHQYNIRIHYDPRDMVQTLDPDGIWPRPKDLT